MEKQFVKYDTAIKLKELGFDYKCFGYYLSDGMYYMFEGYTRKNSELLICTTAPLYQQVINWLREKHNIHIVATPKIMWPDRMVGTEYENQIYKDNKTYGDDGVRDYYETIEWCLEKAINLIENNKNK